MGKCFVTSPPIRLVSQTIGNCVPRTVEIQSVRAAIHPGFLPYQAGNSKAARQHLGTQVKGWSTRQVKKPGWTAAVAAWVLTSLLQYILKHKKTTKCNQQQKQPWGDFRLKSVIG